MQELQEVGVEKKGLRLRLQKAAQKLPSLRINTDIPVSRRACGEKICQFTCFEEYCIYTTVGLVCLSLASHIFFL